MVGLLAVVVKLAECDSPSERTGRHTTHPGRGEAPHTLLLSIDQSLSFAEEDLGDP